MDLTMHNGNMVRDLTMEKYIRDYPHSPLPNESLHCEACENAMVWNTYERWPLSCEVMKKEKERAISNVLTLIPNF